MCDNFNIYFKVINANLNTLSAKERSMYQHSTSSELLWRKSHSVPVGGEDASVKSISAAIIVVTLHNTDSQVAS
jgi:hypothetical protein